MVATISYTDRVFSLTSKFHNCHFFYFRLGFREKSDGTQTKRPRTKAPPTKYYLVNIVAQLSRAAVVVFSYYLLGRCLVLQFNSYESKHLAFFRNSVIVMFFQLENSYC